jgi:serine/threonine protein kinase
MFKRCGTPGYVAPEILRYRDGDAFYSEKCDIFSVGVIFFILLTGHKLFRGDD